MNGLIFWDKDGSGKRAKVMLFLKAVCRAVEMDLDATDRPLHVSFDAADGLFGPDSF